MVISFQKWKDVLNSYVRRDAPYTPAESPSLFLIIGVSTKSEKTFSYT